VVEPQDWAICARVQAGISSRVHERGYYAPMEDFNLDIRRYVLERIGDSVPAGGFPRCPLGRPRWCFPRPAWASLADRSVADRSVADSFVTVTPSDITSVAPRRTRIRWKIFTLLFSSA